MHIFDASIGKLIHRIETDARFVHSQFHPTKPLLAVFRNNGQLLIYDIHNWGIVFDEPVPKGEGAGLVFSESGDSLAVGIETGGTRRWFEFSTKRKKANE